MLTGTAHYSSAIDVSLRPIRSASGAQSTMRRNADELTRLHPAPSVSFRSRCLSNWFDGRAYLGRVVRPLRVPAKRPASTPLKHSQALWTVYTVTLSIHPPASITLS